MIHLGEFKEKREISGDSQNFGRIIVLSEICNARATLIQFANSLTFNQISLEFSDLGSNSQLLVGQSSSTLSLIKFQFIHLSSKEIEGDLIYITEGSLEMTDVKMSNMLFTSEHRPITMITNSKVSMNQVNIVNCKGESNSKGGVMLI